MQIFSAFIIQEPQRRRHDEKISLRKSSSLWDYHWNWDFLAWLSLVGNPHVVETVLGLVLAIIAGGYAYFRLRKLATDNA